MLFTAFAGTTFATMALSALDRSLESNFSITNILVDIASTLPTQVRISLNNNYTILTYISHHANLITYKQNEF